MDDSEKVAYEYLIHLGANRVEYEPEGKSKPPDFLVDLRIAVEVRRLNQHEAPSPTGARPQGLEEMAIPVWNNIQRLLRSLGPPTAGFSWFVDIECSRPIPDRRRIERVVRQKLGAFRDAALQKPTTIQIFENFVVELIRASEPHSDCFVMGGFSDNDSGGFVNGELERNIRICIDEKTAKVSSIRAKYPEWWLVLIDHIGYGGEKQIPIPSHDWDKIILINPIDHTQAFEVR